VDGYCVVIMRCLVTGNDEDIQFSGLTKDYVLGVATLMDNDGKRAMLEIRDLA